MKTYLFLIGLFLYACLSCRKQEAKYPLPAEIVGNSASSHLMNYLVSDQSFIDLVYYSVRNLEAGRYMDSALGASSANFFNDLSACHADSACITNTINWYQLSADTLDEYFYSALTIAVIFRSEHPEFNNMEPGQVANLFEQAFFAGMNSDDPRWEIIKTTLNDLLSRFGNDEIYKADADWADYAHCFSNEIHAIYAATSALVKVVEGIKSGNISKGFNAVKAFMKDHVGRSTSWVRIAYVAWEIFRCCYAVWRSEGDISLDIKRLHLRPLT